MQTCENLKDAINKAFKAYPKKIFMKFHGKKYTFSDMKHYSNKIIHYLSHLGLKYQDKIATYSRNIPDFIILNIAALRMGVTIIPVNYLLTSGEVEYIVKDSGVKHLFVQDVFVDHLKELLDKKTVPDVLILGGKAEGFSNLMEEIENSADDSMDINYPVKHSDLAMIIYTSGTTGNPKGVMLTHNNLLSNVKDLIEITNVSHNAVLYGLLPLFHAYSYTTSFLLCLVWGCRMILIDDLSNGKLIVKTLVKERVNWLIAVPTLFNALSKANLPGIFKLINPLKYCISGAAPLPPATVERFKAKFGLYIHEGYGLSECSPVVSANSPLKPPVIGSVGKALPSVSIKIVGESENEVASGEMGEIIVKGPNVMEGYYNNKEETEKVLKNGWLFTGDYGRFDSDGNLYILDRKKDLIIKHGMNIYPQEIERVLMKEEAIKESAVVGVEVSPGVEVPVAFYETVDKKPIPGNILRNLCGKYLAPYKIPQKFIFLEELPKTPTNKPLKRELKKMKI